MNSHQRRKSKRYWKYNVEFEIKHDDNISINDIIIWCKINIGRQNFKWGVESWRTSSYNYSQCFYFNKDSDAIRFALKWA